VPDLKWRSPRSRPAVSTATGHQSRRRAFAEVAAGAGLALAGHLAAIMIGCGAGRWAAGGRSADALDAGGSLGVLYVMAVAYVGAQLLLLCICGVAAAVAASHTWRFSVGVAAGWVVGFMAVAAMLAGLYVYLDYQSPYY
jgi:hypothetical protein